MAQEREITTTITATTTVKLPAAAPKSYAELNPRLKPTEFFGPVGGFVLTFVTPIVGYGLFYGCNEVTGCSVPPTRNFLQWIGDWPSSAGALWEWKAAGVYLAWYMWTVLCWNILPGEWIEGTLLRDGTRKKYKMNGNGLWTLILTLGITAGVIAQPGGIAALAWLNDHFVPLVSASIAMCTFQAMFVYVYSFFSGELLAYQGNSGNFFYDFWMGRPLNPTFPGFPTFDIKTFNEVRPGIIGWVMLNIGFACAQYERLGRVTNSMWLVVLFQGWYSIDCLLAESSILQQMDITTDGFGFMLSFGDLTWVPFSYTVQARYLVFAPNDLSPVACGLIIALEVLGQYIFRVANNEKSEFRSGRNPKNLKFMETKRGTKLLTSGWWGRSRHPNYFGDWIMAWAWCLPTGFSTPIPYFYVIYFAILLAHRQMRDDEACKEKYGKDWETYCKKVPYKIIPFVY
ncbi:hypothetical protein CspHIS471_0204350 [Cutaneotrichosporon sp. HIS471]|nr:hypothetical protein CspHIS471_0204350 [Cutaneotrichosporon sp. HIS471]